jgi:hypothetical protein
LILPLMQISTAFGMSPPSMARYASPRDVDGAAALLAPALKWGDCFHPGLPPPGGPPQNNNDNGDNDPAFVVNDDAYDLHIRDE